MGDRVLVPFDGSAQALAAIDLAVEKLEPSAIHLLYVTNQVEASYSGRDPGPADDDSTEIMETAVRRIEDHGFDGDVETAVLEGRPDRCIVEAVERADLDHVVMGSHGRDGVARVLLGSVAEKVVRRAPVPVTVVR